METAILLWFWGYDPISIHTLAAASQEILHHLGKNVGKPSAIEAWKKTKSPAVRKQMMKAQNFFKHANTDPNKSLRYPPALGEIFILDALMCYQNITGSLTPLMKAFALRFAIEHPNIVPPKKLVELVIKDVHIDDIADKDRRVFFDIVLPRIRSAK